MASTRRLDETIQEIGSQPPRDTTEPPTERPLNAPAEAVKWARRALERLAKASFPDDVSDPYVTHAEKAARHALSLIPEDLQPQETEEWREVCDLLAHYAAERLAGGAASRTMGQHAQVIWTGRTLPNVTRTYQNAVEAYERINDPAAQARLYTDLARESFQSGQYARAIGCQQIVAGIAETNGDEAGQGEALSAIAYAHLLLENHEKAIPFAERAVSLLTDANRPGPASRALTTLANACYGLNRPTQALSAALNAEALAGSADDLQGRTAALLVLGLAQRDTGSAEDASVSWRTALRIARTLQDPYLTRETETFLRNVDYLRN